MAIKITEQDKKTLVPYGLKGKKITISEMVETKEFKSLHPVFAENILKMVRENPSIGILQGGADRSEDQVKNLFYNNYTPLDKEITFDEYDNDPKKYAQIKKGVIKWNPEDNRWYKAKNPRKIYAVPGASWHTGGFAVDLTGDTSLAGRVSKKYNIDQITSTGEKHHFQPAGVPTSKRMYQLIKERFGVDAIETPLPKEITEWLDSEVASNVPRQPERVMKKLGTLVNSWKETGVFPSPKSVKNDGSVTSNRPWIVSKVTKATDPPAPSTTTTTPPTTLAPTTTTTTTLPSTTTVKPTTTTIKPTTTTSTAPPTTTTTDEETAQKNVVPTTTMAPTTTTSPRTTTSQASTTTTETPTTTMAPTQNSNSTQPTIPPATQYGADSPTTTVPVSRPTPAAGGSRVSPDLQTGLLAEDGGSSYQYAIGVKGRRIFDENGNIVRYEGYKYYTQPRYGTTSGAGAATGTQMVPGVAGQAFEPKYFSGDEDQIYGYSSEQIANLQKAMNAVGLLGGKYSPGVVDNSTRAAYANLLEQANGYGEDADAAIMRLASVGGRGGTGGLTQYRVSNETDIKNVISRVAKQTIGRNLGEGDLNRMAQMYRELEKEAGLAAGSSTQQEVMAAPSPEAFAQSQLETMLPEETNARQFGSYLDAIKEKYQI